MLSRNNPIPPAIRVIDPDPSRYNVCCEHVETVRVEIDFLRSQNTAGQQHRTKTGKRAARRLAAALSRVERIIKQTDVPFDVRLFFPTDHITRWRKRCLELARNPSGRLKRIDPMARQTAADQAVFLVRTYARKPDRQKANQLAAILYGKPHPALKGLCLREWRKVKKSGQK
jgi:hypothetical protein